MSLFNKRLRPGRVRRTDGSNVDATGAEGAIENHNDDGVQASNGGSGDNGMAPATFPDDPSVNVTTRQAREAAVNIGLIGVGNQGSAIGRRLVAGGHTVLVHDADLKRAREVAEQLSAHGPGEAKPVWSAKEAVTSGDIVILATWFPVSTRLAVELSDSVAGKVVIDISNPFNETFDDLVTEPTTSAAEEISRRLPDARLVKAFNTTFAPVLAEGHIEDQSLDVLLASDDDQAKKEVAELVRNAGLRAIDAGPLRNARTLERMTLLLVGIQGRYNLNFAASFKLLPLSLEGE